ncbi:hypothetical protein J6TS7_06580 [Paenibacillus dendritiformis]|nr:hypothetical protein J6TS7_06580 [Paenibacillus dendritiformis]
MLKSGVAPVDWACPIIGRAKTVYKFVIYDIVIIAGYNFVTYLFPFEPDEALLYVVLAQFKGYRGMLLFDCH